MPGTGSSAPSEIRTDSGRQMWMDLSVGRWSDYHWMMERVRGAFTAADVGASDELAGSVHSGRRTRRRPPPDELPGRGIAAP